MSRSEAAATSSITGTRRLDRWRTWLVSLRSRGNHRPMNTDLQAITAQLATVAASLNTLQEALQQLQEQALAIPTTTEQNSEQLIPFTALLMIELTPHFGPDVSKVIVDCLEDCRKIRGYHYYSKMYKFTAGDLQKRKLLLMARCAYQLKFSIGKNDPYRYGLRSTISVEKECPHCGVLANALYDRLFAEGLI